MPTINEQDLINTQFIYPPIPVRCFDWVATFAGCDGADDSRDPVGRGETESDAIKDLLEQCE